MAWISGCDDAGERESIRVTAGLSMARSRLGKSLPAGMTGPRGVPSPAWRQLDLVPRRQRTEGRERHVHAEGGGNADDREAEGDQVQQRAIGIRLVNGIDGARVGVPVGEAVLKTPSLNASMRPVSPAFSGG